MIEKQAPYKRDATKRKNPVKAIRQFCLECVCGVPAEVENCTSTLCPLYAFRFGKNPYRKPMTQEQRQQRRDLALKHGFAKKTRP